MIRTLQHPPVLPTLLYDGDCPFCEYCVDYLAEVTGDSVDYLPYQQQLSHFPELSADRCRASIQWLQPDGVVYQGAAAAFLAMARGGRPGWWYCYRWLPGVALLCEWLYRWVAGHRSLTFRLSRLLVGDTLRPLRYHQVGKLFLRLLALVYLVAFLSCALQIEGLYGSQGIIPLAQYLPSHNPGSLQRWFTLPTVFWFSQANWFLLAVPLAGMASALLLMAGRWPTVNLVIAWLAYLSLVNAGPVFMQYQWDMLLLEAGFIAVLSQWQPRIGVWLYRWLLFRFMWLSGWVKLASGDPMWSSWNALTVHFETQPLPTVFAWYAQQLPPTVLRAATAATLFIELVLPLFIFLPRRPRLLAFSGFALLEGLIFITGNYNFFNILTVTLSLFLLDDERLPTWLTKRLPGLPPGPETLASQVPAVANPWRKGVMSLVALLLLSISCNLFYLQVSQRRPAGWQYALLALAQPFHLSSNYGVFAVMTRQRPEIIIEVSGDGEHWQPYPLRFKPGDPQRMPSWVAPLQPRLDWQLWFAAMRSTPPPWFENLLVRILLESAPVEELMGPLPASANPPRYVRAVRYLYHFTTPAERARSGRWWTRRYLDEYRAPMRIAVQVEHQSDTPMEIPR